MSDLVNKYDKIKETVPRINGTGVIDKKIFSKEANADIHEIGLYVFLVMKAGRTPVFGDKRGVMNMTEIDIYKSIYHVPKCKGNYQVRVSRIKEMLDHLERLGFIELTEDIDGSPAIIIADAEDSFAQVCLMQFLMIFKNAKGQSLLAKLAVYAGFRSLIFMGENGTRIVKKPASYIASIVNSSASTARRQLKWLTDNYVLAYFKVATHDEYEAIKTYYSDISDCKELCDTVTWELNNKLIKDVIE